MATATYVLAGLPTNLIYTYRAPYPASDGFTRVWVSPEGIYFERPSDRQAIGEALGQVLGLEAEAAEAALEAAFRIVVGEAYLKTGGLHAIAESGVREVEIKPSDPEAPDSSGDPELAGGPDPS